MFKKNKIFAQDMQPKWLLLIDARAKLVLSRQVTYSRFSCQQMLNQQSWAFEVCGSAV